MKLEILKSLIDGQILTKSHAARVIGIDRRALHNRLLRLSPELDGGEIRALTGELLRIEREIKKVI